MELTINIEDKTIYQALVQFLKSLRIAILSEKTDKRKIINTDDISLLSEKSLAEEWNSKEDDRWDKIL